MQKQFPNVRHETIADVGHAIHVEKPDVFATMIEEHILQLKNRGGLCMTRQWETIRTYEDIKYEKYNGIAKVTINRPEVRNAFRPKTVLRID